MTASETGNNYFAFAERDLVPPSALCQAATGADYFSRFGCWYEKSSVRSRPRHELAGHAEIYFSPELVPAATHPLVTALGERAVHDVLVRRLYDYLHFTTELEQLAVIPVVSQLARGKAGFELPALMRSDAYKILTDEAWHAQFSYDLMAQVEHKTGVAAGSLVTPHFVSRLQEIRQTLNGDIRGLESFIFAIVSETLISATLVALPRDDRLPRAVRHVVLDHAVDEGRHHTYFAALLTHLWPRLGKHQAQAIGSCVPAMIEAFLLPDRDVLRHELRGTGLTRLQIDEIIEASANDSELRPQIAAAARTTVRYFEQVGALDADPVREAFLRAGLIMSADGAGVQRPLSGEAHEPGAIMRMTELWSAVLGRPVEPHNNLFNDLSADSLQVLELLERIADEIGTYLSVDQLFDNPTPAGAVAAISAGG